MNPKRATTVRGCRKCVPLKVDRKLYSADLVGQVGDLERRGEVFVPLRVEQVVGADAEVEDVARLHAVGIVVVVLRGRLAAA